MPYHVFRNAGKLLFLILSAYCIISGGSSAYAQSKTAPGCDAKVWNAAVAIAQARTAYDVAVIEQFIAQPDSTLAMTCFNRSASVTATNGGAFSGDFTKELTPVVSPALTDLYANFYDSTGSTTSNLITGSTIDYTSNAAAVSTSTTMTCSQSQRQWIETQNESIRTDVPDATFSDLVNGTKGPPKGAGDNFAISWNMSAASGVFENLKQAMAALPVPSVPDYTNCTTSASAIAMLVATTPAAVAAACP